MTSIQQYFEPVNDKYIDGNQWESTQVRNLIDIHFTASFPDLESKKIVIFHVLEYEGSDNEFIDNDCKIRDSFYSLHHYSFPATADLGNIQLMPTRKETFSIVQHVCEYLIDLNIIPIIIGGGHDLSYAVYKAYVSLNKVITLSIIDNKFDIGLKEDVLSSSSYLGKIISHKPSCLFNYVNLGYQEYLVSPLAVDMLEKMNFDIIRLADIKKTLSDVEPIMRNSDFLSFDISSISYAYASANTYSSPNGLSGREACSIFRYAGMSDKISSVGLFEYNHILDINHQTAQLISQMIWYFIDGYTKRKNELNPNLKNCLKYTVSFDDGKNEIVFYKSKNTARWWMGVPFISDSNNRKERYFVACSYNDYKVANQGDIPEKWIKTFNKLSE